MLVPGDDASDDASDNSDESDEGEGGGESDAIDAACEDPAPRVICAHRAEISAAIARADEADDAAYARSFVDAGQALATWLACARCAAFLDAEEAVACAGPEGGGAQGGACGRQFHRRCVGYNAWFPSRALRCVACKPPPPLPPPKNDGSALVPVALRSRWNYEAAGGRGTWLCRDPKPLARIFLLEDKIAPQYEQKIGHISFATTGYKQWETARGGTDSDLRLRPPTLVVQMATAFVLREPKSDRRALLAPLLVRQRLFTLRQAREMLHMITRVLLHRVGLRLHMLPLLMQNLLEVCARPSADVA
jgi:hypothetical protein